MEIGRDCIRPHDLASPRFKANPYPFYARLRAKLGVLRWFSAAVDLPPGSFSLPLQAPPLSLRRPEGLWSSSCCSL